MRVTQASMFENDTYSKSPQALSSPPAADHLRQDGARQVVFGKAGLFAVLYSRKSDAPATQDKGHGPL
jgi:hypothetical protein